MDAAWYYQKNGEPIGPILESEIKRLVAVGKLLPDVFVWNKELPDWIEIKNTVLASCIPVAPPPIRLPPTASEDTPSESWRLWEKLLHGFTLLMVFWAGTFLFMFLCYLLGGRIDGAKFGFWAMFVGVGVARGVSGWIKELPKEKRIRTSLRVAICIPVFLLGLIYILGKR